VQQIERLAPFGHGNTPPLFCATDVELAEPPKRIGDGGRHVALRFRQHQIAVRGVAFGQGDWADELAGQAGPFDIAYRPVINHFRGRNSVELQLADWKPAAGRASS
jgi:single-stranded-DNA-specific exonuclease